jgi:hypothetical protein
MTINEIKTNLGVDITQKNRTVVNVVLKALYVEKQYNELKHLKQSELLRKLCNEINCDRSNIYNYLKKLKNYKLDIATKLIVKGFYEADKQYIDAYHQHIKQCKEDYRNQWYREKTNNVIQETLKVKPFIYKKEKVKLPMNNLQVADYLKANKILKLSKYWDRMITDYTNEDWFNLREINPKMFDSYLK